MNHQQRQGVIFDVEDQPDILTPLSQNNSSEHSKNCGPFVAEEESPLQRPRPPERPRKRSLLLQNQRWSQRLSSAVIMNRSNNLTRWFFTPIGQIGQNKLELADLSFGILQLGKKSPCAVRFRATNEKKCKDVACVVLLPSVLLSLVLIGVCSLFIYLYFIDASKYNFANGFVCY